MVEGFRSAERVNESISGSGGSPFNAQDLFEEQAAAKNIPKEATQGVNPLQGCWSIEIAIPHRLFVESLVDWRRSSCP